VPCGPVFWWKKPEFPEINHRPVASHWLTLSHNIVPSIPHNEWDSNSQFLVGIDTDCIGTHVVVNLPYDANCENNKLTVTTSIVICNRIGGVMVRVLAMRMVDCWFESQSDQTKDYTIVMCCLLAKHAALRRKCKNWLARNQNNVSERSDMSTRVLLFQWATTIKKNSACWSRTKRTSSISHW
jgi:hypothetical protein